MSTAIAEARRKGLPVYGETLHQYLLYSANDYKRPNGQIYHTYPSLKSEEDQKALWHGTANDVIHCVATDELCCTLKDKTIGNRIDDTTGGNSGVEPRLGVMYTEMVARRGYSLSRYVDLVSTNAAKIMGLYPRKGAIAVGSDADIVDPRSHAARQGARRRPARDRLQSLGRARHLRVAGRDNPARQGNGREWPILRRARTTAAISSARFRPNILNGDGPLSDVQGDLACELLAQSLIAWRVAGIVEQAGDGALVIDRNRKSIRIDRAAPHLMFRWTVTVDGRKRGAISLVAVLRQVREALDPGYAANRVRVAVAPLVPAS